MSAPLPVSQWTYATDASFEPVAALTQEALVESVHRGAIAVVDRRGRRVGGVAGDGLSIFLRSAAKPFQALAVIESGAAEAFSIEERELAVMCGSHAGRPEHVEVVERLLARIGMSTESLSCGPSSHTCSGKHAGMIAMALHLGAPVEGYHLASHPVQQEIARVIAELLSGEGRERRRGSSLLAGIDGCGVPMIRAGLDEVAHMYALLAAGATRGLARVRDAMLAHPELVAGEGRLDTGLMRAAAGRVVAKTGAEGIYAVGLLPGGGAGSVRQAVGIVLKVADGSHRAVPVVVRSCLEAFSISVPEEVFVRTRPRTPEGIRGLVQGTVVSLVSQTALLKYLPVYDGDGRDVSDDEDDPRPDGRGLDDPGLKVTQARGDEKELLRFLRAEWPSADEEAFGRPLEWVSEPFALIVRRHRHIVAVLRGHFTGGIGSIDELLVGRGERGAGIGSSLIDRFEAEARARVCSRVVLRAVKDGRAERFYGDRGYRRESVERGHEFGYDYVRLTRELRGKEMSAR